MPSTAGLAIFVVGTTLVGQVGHQLPGCTDIPLVVTAATVQVFSLETLGIALSMPVTLSPDGSLRGGTPEVRLMDSHLVVATPDGSPIERRFHHRMAYAGGECRFSITVPPSEFLDIHVVQESDREGTSSAVPPLAVTGLGPGNLLRGEDLIFEVGGAPPFDATDSRFLIQLGNGRTVDVTRRVALDSIRNAFRLPYAEIEAALGPAPAAAHELSLNLISQDFEFAQAYSFRFLRPGVTIGGRLVDREGNALREMEIDKLHVAIVGTRSGIRRVVPVEADATFRASTLVSDVYTVVVMDLRKPNVFREVIEVPPGSTEGWIDLQYVP